MRRRNLDQERETKELELKAHLSALGLGSVQEYRQWCTRNGFGRHVDKDGERRRRELRHARHLRTLAEVGAKRRERRHAVDLVLAICEGRLGESDVDHPRLKWLCGLLAKPGSTARRRDTLRADLTRLVAHVHARRARFLSEATMLGGPVGVGQVTMLEAIVRVAGHADSWIRDLDAWTPRSHNPLRQFTSLLHHLFVRYGDMPAFFDGVWFERESTGIAERRRWYLRVGAGESVRHCRLPLPYTKRMAHHFMQAPSDLTLDQAVRWGQVVGRGGDEPLARAIVATRLGVAFDEDDFWTTVIDWFVAHPGFPRAEVGPVVDYLQHQRFEPQRVEIVGPRRILWPPVQPNLTMKGRTPAALLRQVADWHRHLASGSRQPLRRWKPSGIVPMRFVEGSVEGRNRKVWTTRELSCSTALQEEGRLMSHCVASYAAACVEGRCSIWAMEVETHEGTTKALTIEVRLPDRVVWQARGRANRLATDRERTVLVRWAQAAGLTLASHV